MRPTNQVYFVLIAELLNDVLTEYKGDATLVLAPPLNVIWVGPKQITEQSLIRHIHRSRHIVNL